MSLYLKMAMAIGVLVAVKLVMSPSAEQGSLARINDMEMIQNARADDSVSERALHMVFETGGNYTMIQRHMKESAVTGKIVEWRHDVLEVSKLGPNRYRVETNGDDASLGATVTVNTRSAIETAHVEGLQPGDDITFKGRIGGISSKKVDIESAVLVTR